MGILIPTYRRREYLEKALASAIGQSHEGIEIIVVDNAPGEGTAGLLADTADRRVRYVANEQDLGLSGSINRAMALFSRDVEWCTILPDDDLLERGFVRAMVAARADLGATSVIHGRRVLIDAAGAVIREANPAPDAESSFAYLAGRAGQKRETYLTGVFFARRAFAEIGGYPQFATGMATDDAFIFALATKDRLYYAAEATVFVRMHAGAESHAPLGSVRHLNALKDFVKYVMTAAGVAGGDGAYDAMRLAALQGVVERYVRLLASAFWLRNVKELCRGEWPEAAAQLDELHRAVRESGLPFTARVRSCVRIMGLCGVCPEAFIWYRMFWEFLRRTAVFCRRFRPN